MSIARVPDKPTELETNESPYAFDFARVSIRIGSAIDRRPILPALREIPTRRDLCHG